MLSFLGRSGRMALLAVAAVSAIASPALAGHGHGRGHDRGRGRSCEVRHVRVCERPRPVCQPVCERPVVRKYSRNKSYVYTRSNWSSRPRISVTISSGGGCR